MHPVSGTTDPYYSHGGSLWVRGGVHRQLITGPIKLFIKDKLYVFIHVDKSDSRPTKQMSSGLVILYVI